MIYVSTACVKADNIKEAVIRLVENGFKAIELSGGTEHYPNLEEDLLELKAKHDLNFLCHNYFPPPKEHFVLNLASLDEQLFDQTISLCKSSISLSNKLNAKKYALHAGFLMDIRAEEFGNNIGKKQLLEAELCLSKFRKGLSILQEYSNGVEIYVENNAMSISNAQTYSEKNPFMFTSLKGLEELRSDMNFKPLVDVAHLKVSINSHKEVYGEEFNFAKELHELINMTDYVHISDNDGKFDQGRGLKADSEMYGLLSAQDWTGKDVTLEVYDGIPELRESYNLMNKII